METHVDASTVPPPQAACQVKRLQRSTWHQLLCAVDERRGTRIGMADLLGVAEPRVHAWREGLDPMPVGEQRRLATLAEARFADDRSIHRLASTVLAQVEAREALESRGPLHMMAVPGSYRCR